MKKNSLKKTIVSSLFLASALIFVACGNSKKADNNKKTIVETKTKEDNKKKDTTKDSKKESKTEVKKDSKTESKAEVKKDSKKTETKEVKKQKPGSRSEIKDIENSEYNSTALIQAKSEIEKKIGFGTGTFISPDTLITNRHVVDAIKKAENAVVRVARKDGKYVDLDVKELIFPTDETLDVGLVKLKEPITKNAELKNVKIKTFASDETIKKTKIGDHLRTVGYPGDQKYGTMWNSEGYLQEIDGSFVSFTAPVSGGASGSPIYNDKNEIIGLANAGTEDLKDPLAFGLLVDSKLRDFVKKHTN